MAARRPQPAASHAAIAPLAKRELAHIAGRLAIETECPRDASGPQVENFTPQFLESRRRGRGGSRVVYAERSGRR